LGILDLAEQRRDLEPAVDGVADARRERGQEARRGHGDSSVRAVVSRDAKNARTAAPCRCAISAWIKGSAVSSMVATRSAGKAVKRSVSILGSRAHNART